MQEEFWHQSWQQNKIAFHEGAPNALLTRHFAELGLKPGDRIFVPLCGKSVDLHWLLASGFQVVGAELSPLAVEQLFAELKLQPQVETSGPLTRHTAGSIRIYQGNLFDLTPETLGPVDAVYDRAAMVALPPDLRARYVAHMKVLAPNTPRLLVCFTYDQAKLKPPPFSIDAAEVERQYSADFSIRLLESVDVKGGLKSVCPATESGWLLSPKAHL